MQRNTPVRGWDWAAMTAAMAAMLLTVGCGGAADDAIDADDVSSVSDEVWVEQQALKIEGGVVALRCRAEETPYKINLAMVGGGLYVEGHHVPIGSGAAAFAGGIAIRADRWGSGVCSNHSPWDRVQRAAGALGCHGLRVGGALGLCLPAAIATRPFCMPWSDIEVSAPEGTVDDYLKEQLPEHVGASEPFTLLFSGSDYSADLQCQLYRLTP